MTDRRMDSRRSGGQMEAFTISPLLFFFLKKLGDKYARKRNKAF